MNKNKQELKYDKNKEMLYWLANPADTDVFKTSSGQLKKVMTSCDQSRRRHDV